MRIVGVFPEDTHPPIIYPAAITTGSASPDAEAFLAFLQSQTAKELFEGAGFRVPLGAGDIELSLNGERGEAAWSG